MKNSTEKSLELKADVKLAYIKLFGKEKGLELIEKAEKEKRRLLNAANKR